MLFDEFTREHPDWEWSERRRRNRLMYDEAGCAWVPMFDPDYGVPYGYDEPGFTPEAEEALVEIARKAREEILAGGGVVFDPDEPDLRSVRYRVIQSDEVEAQLRVLAPEPKRRVREIARDDARSVRTPHHSHGRG